ncbi:hypothetical protein BU15DRAFT_52646, partial [Melanogaster broomeanus]
FMDAYSKGLSGKQAAWASKKCRGHRVLLLLTDSLHLPFIEGLEAAFPMWIVMLTHPMLSLLSQKVTSPDIGGLCTEPRLLSLVALLGAHPPNSPRCSLFLVRGWGLQCHCLHSRIL